MRNGRPGRRRGHAGRDHPHDLDPGVAADRRPVDDRLAALPEDEQRVEEEEDDEDEEVLEEEA